MSKFDGKIALVTGASRGIGKAVALGLAKAGAHVIVLARTQGALEELDDEIRTFGGTSTLIRMDLTRLEKVDLLGPSILEQFGNLDIVVGNAGILGPLKPAHQFDPKEFQKVMVTNFAANTRLIRTLDPLLRASKNGRAIFTAFGSETSKTAYFAQYACSKSALETFVKIYAAETRETNIRVNMVSPGPVATHMLNEAFPGGYHGQKRIKSPCDVVETYLELCEDQCQRHGEIVEINET